MKTSMDCQREFHGHLLEITSSYIKCDEVSEKMGDFSC